MGMTSSQCTVTGSPIEQSKFGQKLSSASLYIKAQGIFRKMPAEVGVLPSFRTYVTHDDSRLDFRQSDPQGLDPLLLWPTYLSCIALYVPKAE